MGLKISEQQKLADDLRDPRVDLAKAVHKLGQILEVVAERFPDPNWEPWT
jgi:hypothetical protein